MKNKVLESLIFPINVCKKYYDKLSGYEYIQIDMRNPYLSQNDDKISS